jgi:phosphotransferase system IIA component
MQTMQVRDIKTKQVFNIPMTADTVTIVTKDGVKVRLHPIAIDTMVLKGAKFDGHTIKGLREMERI